MADFIIIRAEQNSGKTTTAGLTYQALLTQAEKEHVFNDKSVAVNSLKYNGNGDTIDFTAILNIKNKKVAIVSAGDIAALVKVKLTILIKIEVDVIICCARSLNRKGSTYRMILDDFSKSNKIALEVFTQYSKNKDLKYEIKTEAVNKIVDKTIELVSQ